MLTISMLFEPVPTSTNGMSSTLVTFTIYPSSGIQGLPTSFSAVGSGPALLSYRVVRPSVSTMQVGPASPETMPVLPIIQLAQVLPGPTWPAIPSRQYSKYQDCPLDLCFSTPRRSSRLRD